MKRHTPEERLAMLIATTRGGCDLCDVAITGPLTNGYACNGNGRCRIVDGEFMTPQLPD
jgi:hypothetical protein